MRTGFSFLPYQNCAFDLSSYPNHLLVYHKRKCFCFFSLLKQVGFGFIAQKTCFGLFAVILGCFQCCCTKKGSSSSMQGVTLIFIRFYLDNGFAFFWLSYAVSELSFWGLRIHVWRNSLYLFSYINCAVYPFSYQKHVLGFWQLQWKLRALAQKKQQFGFSLQNTLL